ncbi:uncharacterized protein LOC114308222 isoform X1 [Camellia sinensis]|uniref:uncharacterized protein LOC114308222 isoform X1 n=1 Tax=Camellia sinensis TaxID=4442 RepID=UPI0010365258|nr:uncharacterized protein LOC114308222 isoform X1 [Camellia sinensis]
MEPAKIDWKSINSVFVEDDLYEHINAPKWLDFSAPDQSVDDEAWFCRPDCNHPKTVEDFLKSTPPSKFQRSASVSEILPLGDRSRRDANLKRRGLVQPSISSNKNSECERFIEDGENQNPNFSTTPSRQYNIMKATIKSSAEKKQIDNSVQKEEMPRLKSTLSARNLFGGRDIMNQISEFCNELKRLAMRTKEKENSERSNVKKSPVVVKKQEGKEWGGDNLGEVVDEREKERKPLLEVSKEKCETMQKSTVKEKLRRKNMLCRRADEPENIPICVDLKNVKRKEGENLLQIRTCPPSPQCFSATHGPGKSVPPKASRPRPLPERGILQELEQSNTELRKEEPADDNTRVKSASIAAEKEARTLDVFWFLKPCTLST